MKILSKDKIMDILIENNIVCFPVIVDDEYACPTRDWILTDCAEYVKSELLRHTIAGWKKSFDCDDYSIAYKHYSSVCHTITAPTIQGLAVGMVHNWTKERTAHAFNFAIVEDEKVFFIEPQTGKIIDLSVDEKLAIYHVYI